MKYAFLTDNLGTLEKIKKTDILYFGDEFCANKIPDTKTVRKAYLWAEQNGKEFVFVVPALTDFEINKITRILEYLNGQNKKIEIIFNDWGTLLLILRYAGLRPVLGRLLTKQRKDPIADKILNNRQDKMKIISYKNQKVIITPKKVPLSLKTYFQKSFVDVSHVMDFMIANNIKRYELDLLPWGDKLNIDKKIKCSIYYPYVNISSTRYCGAINMTGTNKCKKICRTQKIEVGERKLEYPYVIIGNAVFYKASLEMLQHKTKNKNIDRIVFNDIETLNKTV